MAAAQLFALLKRPPRSTTVSTNVLPQQPWRGEIDWQMTSQAALALLPSLTAATSSLLAIASSRSANSLQRCCPTGGMQHHVSI